jgi:hypothetical protein
MPACGAVAAGAPASQLDYLGSHDLLQVACVASYPTLANLEAAYHPHSAPPQLL